MASLYNIKNVLKKIGSIDDLGQHMCVFGGATPYLYFNKESNRKHSDIDVLVDEKYIDKIRQLAQEYNLYKPELDSLNLDLGDDYGLKLFIDGVYVEFEPMFIDNERFVRKDFSPNREEAGVEIIPFQNITDIINEIDIDGVKIYCQSPELTKIQKERYKREKDLIDISFIDSQGIDIEKYNRIMKSLELSTTQISSYEELKNKKTL